MKNIGISVIVLIILSVLTSCDKNKQGDQEKRTQRYYYNNEIGRQITVTAYKHETNEQTIQFKVDSGQTTDAIFEYESIDPSIGTTFNDGDSVMIDYGDRVAVFVVEDNVTEQNPRSPDNIFYNHSYELVRDEVANISNYYYKFTNKRYEDAN